MSVFTTTENNETSSAASDAKTLGNAYLEGLRTRRYSDKSIQTYAYALKRFGQFLESIGKTRIQDVNREDLEAYRTELVDRGFQPASLHLFLRVVRSFFGWLEANRHIFLNPAAGLAVPAMERKRLPVPTEEEVERLLAQPDTTTPGGIRDRALLEVAYGCALRREELAKLELGCIDLDRQVLRVLGKGSKERMVPLGSQSVHWVDRYLREARPKLLGDHGDTGRLWIGFRNGSLGGPGVHVLLRKHARSAGIRTPITPHSLRRACATHMLNRGAHPVQIQLLLGHRSLRHLSCYLHIGIREMKKIHAQSNPGK